MTRPSIPHAILQGALALAACATPSPGMDVRGPAEAQPSAPADERHAAPDGLEATWGALDASREERPIRHARFGHGPRRVLWIGGIHGNEREGACATAELPAAFLGQPGAEERVTLVVIEDLNPDGSARGTRGNAHGVDLNRNFPTASFRSDVRTGLAPLSEPESLALYELLLAWQPHLVLVAHSWPAQQFVNYDGPARKQAEDFARRAGFTVRESRELGPTPGSLGSLAGERSLPLLTIEYLRGSEPEAAWNATRAAILAAILGD